MLQHPIPVIYRTFSRLWSPRYGIVFSMHFKRRHLSWSISRESLFPDIDELKDQISELGFCSVSRSFLPEHPATSLLENSYMFRSSRHCRVIWPRCVSSHLRLELHADVALDQMTSRIHTWRSCLARQWRDTTPSGAQQRSPSPCARELWHLLQA